MLSEVMEEILSVFKQRNFILNLKLHIITKRTVIKCRNVNVDTSLTNILDSGSVVNKVEMGQKAAFQINTNSLLVNSKLENFNCNFITKILYAFLVFESYYESSTAYFRLTLITVVPCVDLCRIDQIISVA
jgi:hypothetical protein